MMRAGRMMSHIFYMYFVHP